jgi:hypothetical protein
MWHIPADNCGCKMAERAASDVLLSHPECLVKQNSGGDGDSKGHSRATFQVAMDFLLNSFRKVMKKN